MTEAEFLSHYQSTLKRIEEVVEAAINDHDVAIDYESGNDMLTLSFPNRSVLILSRQSAIRQLWLAARAGGFHFDYRSATADWYCASTGQTLGRMLGDLCLSQGGADVTFD